MRTHVALLAVSLVGITLLLGCGGGSSSNSGNSSATTTAPALPQASALASQPGCSAATPGGSNSGPTCSIKAAGGQAPYSWNVTASPSLASVGLSTTISSDTTTLTIQANPGAMPASQSTMSALSRLRAMANSSTNVNVQITVTVTGANGQASSPLSFPLVVTLNAPGISTTSLPNGTVGVAYSASVSGSGGAPPYTWTITGLPAGLTANGAAISGTPTQSGTFSITVRLNDSQASPVIVQVVLSLTILPPAALTITSISPLPGATLGTAYSATITAVGGTAPYYWSVAAGSALPAGLSLTSGSPNATISGTPTATGTFQFTVNVQDSAGTPAIVHATFLLTVTGSSNLNCPSTGSLTLCGTYALGLVGVNGTQGFTGYAATIVVDNSGHVVSGEDESNDSVAGHTKITITGGSYAMDPSGDGRGVLTLINSAATVTTFRFALESPANGSSADIVEFDSSGVVATGNLEGPELLTAATQTNPLPPIPANTILALPLEGVNAAGQHSALLGSFKVGTSGCDGSGGSFNSLSGETFTTNTAGTVDSALTATGSCTAPDALGVGTLQITLSGGTPFTNTTLHFTYFEVTTSSTLGGVFLLETDAIGNSQPILTGFAIPNSNAGLVTGSNFAVYCPCISKGVGTTNGTTAAHTGIANIIQILLTAGSGNTGTVSGVSDENDAGTITTQGTFPYSTYMVDSNGTGTLTGSGQPIVHFILADDAVHSLDESGRVMIGIMKPQNSVSIESPGQPYVITNTVRTLGGVVVSGVLTPSGTTAGTLAGTLDLASETATTAAFAASGSYTSISSTTGRGTGTANLTNSSTINVVIHAVRHRLFYVLDLASTDPFLMEAHLQ